MLNESHPRWHSATNLKGLIVNRTNDQPRKQRGQAVTIYHGLDKSTMDSTQPLDITQLNAKQKNVKHLCLFCKSVLHYLSQCPEITDCTNEQLEEWIFKGKWCHQCDCTCHGPEACTLKKAFSECHQIHLTVVHDIAQLGYGMHCTTLLDRATLTSAS